MKRLIAETTENTSLLSLRRTFGCSLREPALDIGKSGASR